MALNPFGNLMKQAKEMQEKIQQAQSELAAMIVTGEAGGGLIKIEMSGQHVVKRVMLDPRFSDEDPSVMSTLIMAAINDAVKRIEGTTKGKISNMTASMDLPKELFGDQKSDG